MSATTAVRVGIASWPVSVRAVSVTLLGTGLLAVLFVLDIALGDVDIPVDGVVAVLLGGGDPAHQFIVNELRLPQALVAVLVGAALGLSGALTQTFARNPLASPDIVGVTQGASAAAVAAIVLGGAGGTGGGLVSGTLQRLGLPLAALAGGLATAALLYLLAWRGGVDGGRLVLIGIGLGAILLALTEWMLVRARIQDAASATIWLNGSLNARGWDQAVPLIWTLAILGPLAFWLIHRLNALQLGDDTARSLGVPLQATHLLTLLAAVGLAAVAVSAVGPLGFVAFVMPQVALRLTRGSRPPLAASMVYAACLVLAADLITRVVLPFALPVGLVTAAIGAPYLIWLLVHRNRKGSA